MNEDISLLIDLHLDNQRQGPGSEACTNQALEFIPGSKNKNWKIADIGCGTGAQTLDLLERTNGQILAIDLFPEFLTKLKERANNAGFSDRLKTLQRSMDDLPFHENEFDLIWSEGAIYIMGFKKGIESWKPYLKKGGYIAVSELSWITDSRPSEIEDHWYTEYPEIDTVSRKIQVLEEAGFSPVAHFILPEDCWIENYYEPLELRFPAFLDKHDHSEVAQAIVEAEKQEIALYKKYRDYYSYGFYIARKVS